MNKTDLNEYNCKMITNKFYLYSLVELGMGGQLVLVGQRLECVFGQLGMAIKRDKYEKKLKKRHIICLKSPMHI